FGLTLTISKSPFAGSAARIEAAPHNTNANANRMHLAPRIFTLPEFGNVGQYIHDGNMSQGEECRRKLESDGKPHGLELCIILPSEIHSGLTPVRCGAGPHH